MEPTSRECCPDFRPEKWDGKTFNWDKKPFIRATIPTFFHIPFPPMIGKKIVKMWKMAEESGKTESDKLDILCLFCDPHPFKSEIYLSVTGEVPGADNTSLSGTFMARVFDGPYNAIPKFIKEMNEYLGKQDKKAETYYVHYAYCPKCAKEKGKSYMVLFAKV